MLNYSLFCDVFDEGLTRHLIAMSTDHSFIKDSRLFALIHGSTHQFRLVSLSDNRNIARFFLIELKIFGRLFKAKLPLDLT